jgi:hypothetical protein
MTRRLRVMWALWRTHNLKCALGHMVGRYPLAEWEVDLLLSR